MDVIYALVVTYFPQTQPLAALLLGLAPQVERILVIDNTPIEDRRVLILINELSLPQVELLRLGTNLGIAKALNVGIERAVLAGATHVLLSDQDSQPTKAMVAGLLRAYSELVARGLRVGAVGPTFTDHHTGVTYPFQVKVPYKFLYGHALPSIEFPLIETFTLITSGTLIPVTAFADVGMMNENFFIDHVDIEWCHRARAKGFKLFGTTYATMVHHFGDAYLNVWFFGWRKESAYSPVRMYYRIRNFVVLCKAPYVPVNWKIRNGWHWLGFIYSQTVFGQQRLAAMRMAASGLRDGLRERMGPWRG